MHYYISNFSMFKLFRKRRHLYIDNGGDDTIHEIFPSSQSGDFQFIVKEVSRRDGQFFPQSVFSLGKEWAGPFFSQGKKLTGEKTDRHTGRAGHVLGF